MKRSALYFFFNDTATTEIYTLSLHDALPILLVEQHDAELLALQGAHVGLVAGQPRTQLDLVGEVHEAEVGRSEEHTSELQSRQYLVCRLLLEKTKRPCRRCAGT